LMRYFHEHRERLGFELRVTKLGHIQRGGARGSLIECSARCSEWRPWMLRWTAGMAC
jgi:hypothetical protein